MPHGIGVLVARGTDLDGRVQRPVPVWWNRIAILAFAGIVARDE